MIKVITLILISLMTVLLVSGQAFAHVMLQQADPSPGAQLDSSPETITLIFNERLEQGLYQIKLLGQSGKHIANQSARMSDDRRQITLKLPLLANGNYTVSYKVVSIDGHPVEGSYVFTVGNIGATQTDLASSLKAYEGSSTSGLQHVLLYMLRGVYFLLLLCMVGWIFWGRFKTTNSEPIRRLHKRWFALLHRCFMFSLLALISIELLELLQTVGREFDFSAWLNSIQGMTRLTGFCLAIVGFIIIRLNQWLCMLWGSLLLAVESMNGHASAIQPTLAIPLDFVHLCAAAVWSGGLLYILIYRGKFTAHIHKFLSKFSSVALLSIITLVATGLFSTFLYHSNPLQVFHSQWGQLLIAKAACVFLVVIIGAYLRTRIKRKQVERLHTLVKVDFAMMLIIVGITSIFTHLNPNI